MGEADVGPAGHPCPRCGGALAPQTMRTAVWQGERLAVVEDVPAQVCQGCMEQYYDDDVSDALRVLNERGFPEAEAQELIQVPVFSLRGRIRVRRTTEEDAYVD